METPILVAIVGLLAIPVGAVLNWFLSRRKNVADLYNSIAEAGQAAVESVSTALETVRHELDEAHAKIDTLLAENNKLTIAIQELKVQNEQLIRENAELRTKVVELTDTLQKIVTYEQATAAELSSMQSEQHDNWRKLFRNDESQP